MASRSLANAPKSTLRWWGLKSAPAFDLAVETLAGHGCDGPRTWSEGALVPFSKEVCPTIKATVSLSACSADNGYAAFDCAAVLHSRTIRDRTESTDPWSNASAKPTFPGFTPCLVIHLAHLKWCEREGEANPAWAMTMGGDTAHANVHVWAADFARLLVPVLDRLTDDDPLEALLTKAVGKSKPRWVRSDAPHFVWLPERLERLKSRSRSSS